ncbi:MAG: TetM/TetW/TetO/TetS family tetracycline resistance ribosomal protection protein [Eubacterium sp.]|nr:TetM/TetW/TetO/TetS family tetracycline resistance ribosomal protection protein [Eubacterium sp.]
MKDKLTIGILAHVDAGKTTLSEQILYRTGKLRKAGRVDHQDAFLDNFELERARGITIFSKQALFELEHWDVTLLDTPGHVDFSAEMERTLQVLDYAILLISGADGVQGHTQTLWKLLINYQIPTFLFVNKMDQEGTDREKLSLELKKKLSDSCITFDEGREEAAYYEEIAMTDEEALDQYMEENVIDRETIRQLIRRQKVYPVYYGSALKGQGIDTLLRDLDLLTIPPAYHEEFGARVFKITRGDQGERLTHLKVTGGSLKVKTSFGNLGKANQIRLYHGNKYTLLEEAVPGTVCAVTGLDQTAAGQGLGIEEMGGSPVLEPVLSYQMILPEGADLPRLLRDLKILEEEEPMLHVSWDSHLMEIHVQLMGQVQTDILKSILSSRFRLDVEFGPGKILYKETIQNPVIGIGHYEPLRHYAEVQLLIEPAAPGSGLTCQSRCSEDFLDKNWQRLILTHILEKEHLGVLAGMPLTDVTISILAGRAHKKHTEGGDFRQATYRAIRQGLKKAVSILLEPWFQYRLEVPSGQLGRAMSDLQLKHGSFEPPQTDGDYSILTGIAPAVNLQDYQKEVWAYTKGKGRLSLRMGGYLPCHNQEEVLESLDYDSERDVDNPTGSVFCSHGAGFVVPWDQVGDYAHIKEKTEYVTGITGNVSNHEEAPRKERERNIYGEDAEFLAIYHREFGRSMEKQEQRLRQGMRTLQFDGNKDQDSGRTSFRKDKDRGGSRKAEPLSHEKKYLLVDGYNIIYAWDELKMLAQADLGAARLKLMDILSNYQGFIGDILILVFDAYKVEGNPGEIFRYHNIHVVFTREKETADQYIEKTTHEIARKHQVRVATSDVLEQVIVMGQGADRLSAADLYEEIGRVEEIIRGMNLRRRENDRNYLLDYAPEDLAPIMEDIRLGKKEF